MKLRSNRFFSLLMVILILWGAIWPGGVNHAYADSASCGATVDDPCIIMTVEQLQAMETNTLKYYELGKDLDLTGRNWTPIGNFFSPFKGHLDGKGFTISNLTIDTGGAGTSNLGLFGSTSDAVIRNIGLIDTSIEGDNGDYVGGLVGYSMNTSLEQVYVTGTISAGSQVGGLAGYTANGAIVKSYSATTISGSSNFGGLVGKTEGFMTVTSSYYNSTLTNTSVTGSPLTTTAMMNSESFSGWNFSDSESGGWRILEGSTYPMHQPTFDRITLNGLAVEVNGEDIALDPTFRSDRLQYEGIVPNPVSSVTVSASALSGASIN